MLAIERINRFTEHFHGSGWGASKALKIPLHEACSFNAVLPGVY